MIRSAKLARLSRRRVLKGLLQGGTVTVGLPLLDLFLNDSGRAYASGKPLPVRFATWFWGLGMNARVFVPTTAGSGYDLPEELAAIAPVRDLVNVFTGFNAYRDSAPNLCHYTGWIVTRSGQAPIAAEDKPGETIDVAVARAIGRSSRFPSLSVTANGDMRTSFSYENANSVNPSEPSPLNLYTNIFGAEYQDPNGSSFTPSPRVMARRSVLSGVMEQSRELEGVLGAADRARLDQYFTGLRNLERQFDQQLTKPEPIAACSPVAAPAADPAPGIDSDSVAKRHRMLTDLLVMALACDQTRVVNMAYSAAFASTIKSGYEKPHHTATHEEPVDAALGYQPISSWFARRALEEWTYFVQAFTRVREGDGTLLDNMLIYGSSDSGLARVHSIDNMPMFTAGRAGGRLKTGLHIAGDASAATRVGYTAMKVLGVDIAGWGSKSNATSKDVGEMLA